MRFLVIALLLLFSCNNNKENRNVDTEVIHKPINDSRQEREILSLIQRVPKEKRVITLYAALADPSLSRSKYLASLCDVLANAPAAVRAKEFHAKLQKGKMQKALGRDFYKAYTVLHGDKKPLIGVLERDGRFSPVTCRVNWWAAVLKATYMTEYKSRQGSKAYALIAKLLGEVRRGYPYNGLEFAEIVVTDSRWINEYNLVAQDKVQLITRLIEHCTVERDSIERELFAYNAIQEYVQDEKVDDYINSEKAKLAFYFNNALQAKELHAIQVAMEEASVDSCVLGNAGFYKPIHLTQKIDTFEVLIDCQLDGVRISHVEGNWQSIIIPISHEEHMPSRLNIPEYDLRDIFDSKVQKGYGVKCSIDKESDLSVVLLLLQYLIEERTHYMIEVL